MNKRNSFFYIICSTIVFFIMCIGVWLYREIHKIFKTIDSELYYYGFNSLDEYDYIAQHIRPIGRINDRIYGEDYAFQGIYLIDKEQWFLYKGGKNGAIIIDSICSYGFNDSMLVAEVITEQGMRYYDVTDFSDYHNSTQIQVDTSCITSPITYFNLNKWIYDVNNPPQSLCAMSDFCFSLFFIILLNEILLIILFIMFVVRIIKLKSLSLPPQNSTREITPYAPN